MAASTATTKPTIAILSMGMMGAGVASLLHQHSYHVLTDLTSRSQATHRRAETAGATSRPFAQLVSEADIFLSILPPGEALPTALQVSKQLDAAENARAKPLLYFDLNAISPRLTRQIHDALKPTKSLYIDGGIIGAPPKKHEDENVWKRPSIVTSGPLLSSCIDAAAADELSSVLNLRHVSLDIGSASGLKMCYASMSKGMTALAIQSFVTAQKLGVLEELRDHLSDGERERAESGMLSMQSKAYRWVREMEEISSTHEDDGDWGNADVFSGIAAVYRTVGETSLARESEGRVEDVVEKIAGALSVTRRPG